MWGKTFKPKPEPRQQMAAGQDPNDLRNFHPVCPYMVKHTMNRVCCKGNSKIDFPSIALCREYKQRYCCADWQACTITEACKLFDDTEPN